MGWQPELDELRKRERQTRELGGAERVKRQHDAGKLTVRERIDALVDPTSFHEIGAIAGILLFGLIFRNASPNCSPFEMLTGFTV